MNRVGKIQFTQTGEIWVSLTIRLVMEGGGSGERWLGLCVPLSRACSLAGRPQAQSAGTMIAGP